MYVISVVPFQEGVELVVSKILSTLPKLAIVSVHGEKGAGKTTLCRKIMEQLYEKHGIAGRTLICNESPYSVPAITRIWPRYFLIEGMINRVPADLFSQEQFGRIPDQFVYITGNEFFPDDLDAFNQGILNYDMERDAFDLVIENPDAASKSSHFLPK